MNSLSAGEIESFSREAFLSKTDEVLDLISPYHSQGDLHRGKPGTRGRLISTCAGAHVGLCSADEFE
jgi:hypothetical protein